MRTLCLLTLLLLPATVGAQQEDQLRAALIEHVLKSLERDYVTPPEYVRQWPGPAAPLPSAPSFDVQQVGPQWRESPSTIRPMRLCTPVGQFATCF